MQMTFGKRKKITLEITTLQQLLEAVKEHGGTTFSVNGSIFKIDALYVSKTEKR